jgi:hypothetical protein
MARAVAGIRFASGVAHPHSRVQSKGVLFDAPRAIGRGDRFALAPIARRIVADGQLSRMMTSDDSGRSDSPAAMLSGDRCDWP